VVDVSRYLEIANDLRRRIAAGEWPVGARLPGISDLQDAYGAALNTIRAAEQVLRQEGVLRISAGQGAFVLALPRGESTTEVLDALYAARDAVASAISAVERQQKSAT
jgi:DNA-binding GntR family transcriptional regulator